MCVTITALILLKKMATKDHLTLFFRELCHQFCKKKILSLTRKKNDGIYSHGTFLAGMICE